MSVEFRQRKPGELLGILKRQKWLILLPMITLSAAIGYVVYSLPSIYESTSLLTVKPPTISSNLVQSLSNEDLSQRLSTINQEVLSRSSLEPMVQKYDLYKPERDAGLPMELIIEKMYKNINVDLEETGTEKVAAFRIRYRDRDPQAARSTQGTLHAPRSATEPVRGARTAQELASGRCERHTRGRRRRDSPEAEVVTVFEPLAA